jgi:tRNA(Ile)-lysidine synthase
VIRLLVDVPHRVNVAVSGGIDSMASLDFLIRGGREVQVLHFDHGTPHGRCAREFMEGHCRTRGLRMVTSTIRRERNPGESLEEFWSAERHRFFEEHRDWGPIVTGHHLGDAVEWWILTALHGAPRLMPAKNIETGVIRPFLSTPRKDLEAWCKRKGVPHVDDPSNESRAHMRNVVRHDILPHALRVNPGLGSVVQKKLLGLSGQSSRETHI